MKKNILLIIILVGYISTYQCGKNNQKLKCPLKHSNLKSVVKLGTVINENGQSVNRSYTNYICQTCQFKQIDSKRWKLKTNNMDYIKELIPAYCLSILPDISNRSFDIQIKNGKLYTFRTSRTIRDKRQIDIIYIIEEAVKKYNLSNYKPSYQNGNQSVYSFGYKHKTEHEGMVIEVRKAGESQYEVSVFYTLYKNEK